MENDYIRRAVVVRTMIKEISILHQAVDTLCDFKEIIPPNVLEELAKAGIYLDRASAKLRTYEKENCGTVVK